MAGSMMPDDNEEEDETEGEQYQCGKGDYYREKKRDDNDNDSDDDNNDDPNSDKERPEPIPPSVFVNLLQRDPNVKEYFVSLKSNLDYDVARWKQRTKTAQEGGKKCVHSSVRNKHHLPRQSW